MRFRKGSLISSLVGGTLVFVVGALLFRGDPLLSVLSNAQEVHHGTATDAPTRAEYQVLKLELDCVQSFSQGSWANYVSEANQILMREGHSSQSYSNMRGICARQRSLLEAAFGDLHNVLDFIKREKLAPEDARLALLALKARLSAWDRCARLHDIEFVRQLEAEAATLPAQTPGPEPKYPPLNYQKKDTP
jgi:hypothetical protein